jgi:hypothetical protein
VVAQPCSGALVRLSQEQHSRQQTRLQTVKQRGVVAMRLARREGQRNGISCRASRAPSDGRTPLRPTGWLVLGRPSRRPTLLAAEQSGARFARGHFAAIASTRCIQRPAIILKSVNTRTNTAHCSCCRVWHLGSNDSRPVWRPRRQHAAALRATPALASADCVENNRELEEGC